MKRLFALLLICLLPMQVFAGMLTYKTGIDSAALELRVQQQQMLEVQLEMQRQLTEVAGSGQTVADDLQAVLDQSDQADRDDDTSYADSEDFSNHAGIGDETVLNPTLAFIVDSATLAPALRSDDVRQPPFLPPAGRPPRV
ncbi:hypothetical protein [Herbaspirillum rhizosphaerae]|uniref:hypothetical protein n=1 Tax=Herbaspirillum rhizosphaerae TaxID=346179 RepID=UPI00067CEFA9|nr:hypothetical protein [Herbaspirillum rhizosphaerae]